MKRQFTTAVALLVAALTCAGAVTPAAEAGIPGVLVAGNGERGYSGEGGLAVHARLNNPTGLALSLDHQKLYIHDTGNLRIREVDLATGVIRSVAWVENTTTWPNVLRIVDGLDNLVTYAADTDNHKVVRLSGRGNSGDDSSDSDDS